ncbi:MAG: FAD:protein FMN transferase [Dehalococcoidaceae bacterium]|nr:FAD:protein FMN transferase [Dehalococcoidaceae bacterium]
MRYSFKLFIAVASILVLTAASLGLAACSGPSLTRYEETVSSMGTFITVTLYAGTEQAAQDAIAAAFERIRQIETAASIFDENAEAYRLNQQGSINNPSQDLRTLVELSIEYGELTGGYFDITVQPVLELWEAGLWQESPDIQQQRVTEALRLTGYERIMIEQNSISLPETGMKITLGGIAKGYAANEALKVLAGIGIEHALVNAGGDISTLGSKPDGSAWVVELANPDDTTQRVASFLLSGYSIATSGNYERYFDSAKKAHHLLNPHTGYSSSECISVTIITASGALSDTLATAVFVMGPAEGLDFINNTPGVEGLIIDNDRVIHRSSGLAQFESSND